MDPDYVARVAAQDAGVAQLWLLVGLLLASGALWRQALQTLPARLIDHQLVIRWPRRWFVWICVLALCLRLPGLVSSFWYDETFTAGIARMDALRAIDVIRADVHPPGAYIAFWLVGRYSTSEFALRLPALMCGLWSLWLIYRVAVATKANQQTARLAVLLAAIMPAHIEYSTEARAYTMMLCGVLLLVLATARRRPGLYLIATAITTYTHAIGLVYVGVIGLAALFVWPRFAGILWRSAIIAAPAAALALYQSSDVADGGWWNVYTLAGATWWPLKMTLTDHLSPDLLLVAYVPWIAAILTALLQRRLLRRAAAVWLAATIGVPAALAAVSSLWAPVWLDRALLPSAMQLLIIVAAMAVRTRFAIYRHGLALALTISLVSYFSPAMQSPDMDRFYDFCGDRPVYVLQTAMGVMSSYYRPGQVFATPTRINDLYQSLPADARAAFGMAPAALPEFAGRELCLVLQATPLMSTREINQFATIQASFENSLLGKTGWFQAYRVAP